MSFTRANELTLVNVDAIPTVHTIATAACTFITTDRINTNVIAIVHSAFALINVVTNEATPDETRLTDTVKAVRSIHTRRMLVATVTTGQAVAV